MRSHAYNPMRILDAFFVFMFLLLLFFFSSCTSAHASSFNFGLDGGLAVPTQNYFPPYLGDANDQFYNYNNALEASEGYILSGYVTHRIWKGIDGGVLFSYDSTGASAPTPFFPGSVGPRQEGSHVKQNLGDVYTYGLLAYTRIHPWTFGNWQPFFGAGLGWSWNQWVTGNPQNMKVDNGTGFSAHVSDAVMTRLELGTTYRVSDHFALEGMIGGQINDPLTEILLPGPGGGTDENMNLILFFVQVGVHFSL